MEPFQGTPRDHERPRAPYPRTSSRSSNGTTHSRLMSQSVSSSAIHVAPSARPQTVHPSHRFYHQSISKPPGSPVSTTSRPPPQLSREGSMESSRVSTMTPVSSFLQEKLQRGREAEGHRKSASRTSLDLSASIDLSTMAPQSPVKLGSQDGGRPQSRCSVDSSTRKGLCLKEMEHVISGLHKQNFDLKLELYHRRERQTIMEERLESIESERAQVDEINDKLVEELEKRDKAVEEAVAMIVALEAKLEDLTQDRPAVPSAEDDVFFHASMDGSSTQPKGLDLTRSDTNATTLTRMPSFLSERTEQTANLRNVYLGAKGSALSLARVAEGSSDVDGMPIDRLERLASPSLSVLSESSFVSVYGRKDDNVMSLQGGDLLSLDSVPVNRGMVHRRIPSSSTYEELSRTPISASFSRSMGGTSQFPLGGHALSQRAERYDIHYQRRNLTPQSPTLEKLRVASGSSEIMGSPGQQQSRLRDQKRAGLRKVLTDIPGGVSLSDQRMPPTPDTVTSSILRRFKHSDDALSRKQDSMSHRSQASQLSLGPSIEQPPDQISGVSLQPKPTPITHDNMRNLNEDYQRAAQIQRPRSADETTVSHRKDRRWSMDSDESQNSLQSSLDIWLRAGGPGPNRVDRASPDLFGFPTNTAKGGWAMDAMFGHKTVYSGGASIVPGPNSDQMHDLFTAQTALFGTVDPPPPPHRRSSLSAQTGQTPPRQAPAKAVKPPKSPRRQRHFRRNSDDSQIRAAMKISVPGQATPSTTQLPVEGDHKRNHYPPITGSAGPRNGLVRLWRRSIGGGSSNPLPDLAAMSPSSEKSPMEGPKNPQVQPTGVPSWVSRNNTADDGRSGCTPPPIMLKPHHTRGNSLSDIEPYGPTDPMVDASLPRTPVTAGLPGTYPDQNQVDGSPAAGSATGARRKWLPTFGRGSNLKG